nr:hypothetical protein CFP56_75286 [Quercus suber]
MIRHGKKHEWYAALNGLVIAVSSVGSMISATMWQGYVVLIPCVIGSIYCNWFWRKRLGYDRESAQVWLENGAFDIDTRLQNIVAADSEKSSTSAAPDSKSFNVVYEQRFLLELYGCYLAMLQETDLYLDEKSRVLCFVNSTMSQSLDTAVITVHFTAAEPQPLSRPALASRPVDVLDRD